jgi:hypothetical protein
MMDHGKANQKKYTSYMQRQKYIPKSLMSKSMSKSRSKSKFTLKSKNILCLNFIL